MKSKAPLALMEQMVMLLVFALAAALCLQAFVKSDQISLKSQAKSNAALMAQNTAEMIRYSGGSLEHAFTETADRQSGSYLENEGLAIAYDEEWKATAEKGTYLLTVQEIPTEEEGLHKVLVQVVSGQGEEGMAVAFDDLTESELLFEMETAWLEVEGHE